MLPSGYQLKSPEGEEEFEEYYKLRWEVLRKPWKQERGTEKDALEESAFHLLVLNPNYEVVGCARLQMNSQEQAQVRYMAVDPSEQGKHIGATLLSGLEKQAKEWGVKEVFLQAREPAVPFYQKCGYTVIERTFLLFDEIQHFSMGKKL